MADDGLTPQQRYLARHPERRKAATRAYTQKPAVKARMRAHKRKYYQDSGGEKDKAYVRRWRAANPDKVADYNGASVSVALALGLRACQLRTHTASYCVATHAHIAAHAAFTTWITLNQSPGVVLATGTT